MLKKFKRSIFLALIVLMSVCLTGCSEYIDPVLSSIDNITESIDAGSSVYEDQAETAVPDATQDTAQSVSVNGQITVSFLDTGQSNATLIQTAGGENILIDTGDATSRDELLSDLNSHGVDYLDLLVITHWHLDHAGGAAQVIQTFEVEQAWVTDNVNSNVTTTNALQALNDYGVETSVPSVGDSLTFSGCTFTVIGPVENYTDQNQSSIVIRMTYGNTTFLFPGDMEKDATSSLVASGQDLSCDVLLAPHHGSAYAVSDAFWNACGSGLQFVVVECGEGNSYGHPHQEVLDYCSNAGITLYRTDQNGEVQIASDGTNVWVASVEKS